MLGIGVNTGVCFFSKKDGIIIITNLKHGMDNYKRGKRTERAHKSRFFMDLIKAICLKHPI